MPDNQFATTQSELNVYYTWNSQSSEHKLSHPAPPLPFILELTLQRIVEGKS